MLTSAQIDSSRNINTPWGEIGYITYKRTYSRRLKSDKVDSPTEEFLDTIIRVINACDRQLNVGFTPDEEYELAELMLKLRGSVAGRFLWQLGTKTVDKLGLPSLQNCAGVVVNEPIRPFTWAMDMLMLGSGVGYNIQKEHVYQLPKLTVGKKEINRIDSASADFIIPDTREGWVKLLGKVLKSHFYTGHGFTYSAQLIRSKGAAIKGFGGTSSGPDVLCQGISDINKILNKRAGKKLRPIDCLDIMNIIGSIVVSGNVRRSAQLAIGDYDDLDFIKAKRWDLGTIPNWRAMSNNSIVPPERFDDIPSDFWETYKQGEPYGLINLDLSRKCGRIGEDQYPDENIIVYNPCVTGDTEILTKNGYQRIDTLVDIPTEIWNGFEWSEVVPKITGHNQHLLKVTLSDGRELTCTDYHKWYLSTNYTGGSIEKQTNELCIGDKLIKHKFPVITDGEYVDPAFAYTQGFISADGQDGYNFTFVYEPKFQCIHRMDVHHESKEYILHSGCRRKCVYHSKSYSDKTFIPFSWDIDGKLNWLSGYFDGDGTELIEGGLQAASIDRNFLLELQKMLSTIGINSKIVSGNDAGYRAMPDGSGGYKDYFCNTTYRICISAVDMQRLKELGMKCERLSFTKTPNRDASHFVKVIKIEDAGFADCVYCFNEPLRHYGVFNGILTGQCAEQSLENYESCCLAEVFLPNIETKDELFKVVTYLYRICKHSLAIPCSIKETEQIVHSNMRMGIGVTGVLQASEKQKSWLSDCYEHIREYDVVYSKQHNWPTSIKLTTCKPSGTLSLLAGVTPGIHPSPAGPYYIRRIRMSADSDLVNLCRQNGYFVEYARGFDGKNDVTTVVVEFPCKVPDNTPIGDSLGAIQHLELVKWLQTNWSDNSVSCTIYYKENELDEIKTWLSEHFNNSIKTVSFLLYHGHGFDQAPYETITKERYDGIVSKVTPITSGTFVDDNFDISDCETGVCPIK